MSDPSTRMSGASRQGLADAPLNSTDQYNAIRARLGQVAADKWKAKNQFLDSNSTAAQQLARGLLPQ